MASIFPRMSAAFLRTGPIMSERFKRANVGARGLQEMASRCSPASSLIEAWTELWNEAHELNWNDKAIQGLDK